MLWQFSIVIFQNWNEYVDQTPLSPANVERSKQSNPPTNPVQVPKRATKEVAHLDGSKVLGNNGPTARNTRSRFAKAAALALLANSSVGAHH